MSEQIILFIERECFSTGLYCFFVSHSMTNIIYNNCYLIGHLALLINTDFLQSIFLALASAWARVAAKLSRAQFCNRLE